MATGVIKWFNHNKGFGCIKQDNDCVDLFVHVSAIPDREYDSLDDGDHVSFQVVKGKKGFQADNVRKCLPV